MLSCYSTTLFSVPLSASASADHLQDALPRLPAFGPGSRVAAASIPKATIAQVYPEFPQKHFNIGVTRNILAAEPRTNSSL